MENPLWGPLIWAHGKKDMYGVLAALPAFEGLSRGELKLIGRTLHERQYRKGEIVFNESEPGAGMYIIKKGEVTITRKTEGNVKIILTVVREPNFFGELALLDEIPRSATATATADTVLFGFSKPALEGMCSRNPRLGIKILLNLSKLVCRRLLRSNDTIETLETRLKNTIDPHAAMQGDAIHG
jgi:CRP/FNR family transcriptional regulator, cyclic AMP receptor protein